MSGEQETTSATVYLLGPSVLDRLAYRRLLKEELGCDVTVESDFRPTSVWAAMRHRPNLVLVDSDAPHLDVLDAVQMIGRLRPEANILIISAVVEPGQVEAWARCPMRGYVVKDGGMDELRAAIEAIANDGEYYSDGIREALTNGIRNSRGIARLSRREAELLPLLARGMTLREAASHMTISYKTADAYRSTLLRKLGIRDRVELARYAIRERIIDP